MTMARGRCPRGGRCPGADPRGPLTRHCRSSVVVFLPLALLRFVSVMTLSGPLYCVFQPVMLKLRLRVTKRMGVPVK